MFPLIPLPASPVASLCSDTDLNLPRFCSEYDTIYCCIVRLYCHVAVGIHYGAQGGLIACTFGPRVSADWHTWLRCCLGDDI